MRRSDATCYNKTKKVKIQEIPKSALLQSTDVTLSGANLDAVSQCELTKQRLESRQLADSRSSETSVVPVKTVAFSRDRCSQSDEVGLTSHVDCALSSGTVKCVILLFICSTKI